MITNYEYFIALAEEENISKAAARMFVSHQCISRYLANVEKEYNISFFDRKPHLSLTPAGRVMLDTLHQVKLLEENLQTQLSDIRKSKKGLIRFGTTEGRYRILVPDLVSLFKAEYPDVTFQVFYNSTDNLHDMLVTNKLDIALLNKKRLPSNRFDVIPALNERLYMVISENMLKSYISQDIPALVERFRDGVDLELFSKVPFILNYRGFNSREMLEDHLSERELTLNCVMELTQQDLHFMMTSLDYAVSFCFSMYLPTIKEMNQSLEKKPLYVFPIRGLNSVNQMVLVTTKGRILPSYGKKLVQMILEKCRGFE